MRSLSALNTFLHRIIVLVGIACLFGKSLPGFNAYGASYTSAASGSWGTGTNWSAVAPAGGPDPENTDDVLINGGFDIVVDNTSQTNNDSNTTVDNGHTITVSASGSTFQTQHLSIRGNGVVTVNTGAVTNLTGDLRLGNGSGTTNSVVINGSGSVMHAATSLYGAALTRGQNITYVGNTSNASMTISGGGHYETYGTGNQEVRIGNAAGVTGTLTIDGAGSQFYSNHDTLSAQKDIHVGYDGTGNLYIKNSGDLTTNQDLFIGTNFGSSGTVVIGGDNTGAVGSGATLNFGLIAVGNNGTGSYVQHSGTVNTVVGTFDPVPPGPQRYVGQAITQANPVGDFYVGGFLSNGTMVTPYPPFPGTPPPYGANLPTGTGSGTATINGGTLNIGGVLNIGELAKTTAPNNATIDTATAGTFTVTGGTVNIRGQEVESSPAYFPTSTVNAIIIGNYSRGVYVQTGGTVTTGVAGAGGSVVVANYDSPQSNGGAASSLTLSGGTLNIGGQLMLGGDGAWHGPIAPQPGPYNADSTGAVFLNGGTLSVDHIHAGWGGGTISFNGTVVKANMDSANFIENFNGAGPPTNSIATIAAGGAIFDSNGHSIVITSDFGGTGGFTKQGLGTVTFSNGTAHSYTGTTTVTNGTLRYSGNNRIGTGAVTVNRLAGSPSAILDLGTNLTDTVGTVTLDGVFSGGRIDGTGTSVLTSTGTFEMRNGTVTAGLGGAGIALNKTTTGTVTLMGSSTYTGLTTVSAGTLTLNNPLSNNTTILTDGVAGTTDILINGGNLLIAASQQIGNTGSVNMTSGSFRFSGSGKTETIGSFTNSGGTLVTGANTIIGTANTITWSGGTNTISSGGLISDASWLITGGTNTVQAGGVLEVLSGGGATGGLHFDGTSSPTITVNSSAGPGAAGEIRLANDVYVDAGLTSGTARILNGGALANPGFVNLGGDRTFDINNGSASTDMLISARITNGGMIKTNTGTLELTGNNTFAGDTYIAAGTIRASADGALGGTGLITVDTGGTLLLAGTQDTRVNDSAAITLNGGQVTMQGVSNETETMGALTLTADSTINFGTGSGNTMTFSSLNLGAFRLQIYGWTGTMYTADETLDHGDATQDRILFVANPSLTSAQRLQVLFFNDAGQFMGNAHQVMFGASFELVPVPEPSTYLGALGLVCLIGYRERRRVHKIYRQLASRGKSEPENSAE